MPIGYTYITSIDTGKVVLLYAGKKHSEKFIPTYYGSGVMVARLRKRGAHFRVHVNSWHETHDELNAAEIDLIAKVKSEYGRRCVNISFGGDGNNRLLWETDARFRKKMIAANASDKRRKSISDGQTYAWKNPEIRERRSMAIKKAFADPEIKAKKHQAIIEANQRPELRKKRKSVAIEVWSRPESREARIAEMKKFMNTPEAIEKRRAGIKAAWARRKAAAG